MAHNIWEVLVFLVKEENFSVPKYNRKVKLRADYDPQGISVTLLEMDETTELLEFPVDSSTECCKVGLKSYLFSIDNETLLVKFNSKEEARDFALAITKVKSGRDASVFSVRTEDSSATQYFQFYGYLSQQQNMLQDFVRTYTYQRAILSNLEDFKDKVVLDVGAGSGILSFFAAQAGAKRIYAVEASTMAHYAQKLVDINNFSNCIKVLAVKSPTRVTSSASKCIDNFLVSANVTNFRSCVMNLYLSDHYAQAISINTKVKCEQNNPKLIYGRNYNAQNVYRFYQYLENENWRDIYDTNCTNLSFEKFSNIILYYFELCFPLIRTSIQQKKAKDEWITTELMELRNRVAIYNDLSKISPEYSDISKAGFID